MAQNPASIWAWVGLAGDIVDVAVPFLSGVGETIRAVKAMDNALDAADASLTTLYRSVSALEAEDIMASGKFNLPVGGMESKQFAFDFDETVEFGKRVKQNIIVSVDIPTNMLDQFYRGGVDTSIFRSGTLTVYGDQLDLFNQLTCGSIRFME